jgi:hypothetical protein
MYSENPPGFPYGEYRHFEEQLGKLFANANREVNGVAYITNSALERLINQYTRTGDPQAAYKYVTEFLNAHKVDDKKVFTDDNGNFSLEDPYRDEEDLGEVEITNRAGTQNALTRIKKGA